MCSLRSAINRNNARLATTTFRSFPLVIRRASEKEQPVSKADACPRRRSRAISFHAAARKKEDKENCADCSRRLSFERDCRVPVTGADVGSSDRAGWIDYATPERKFVHARVSAGRQRDSPRHPKVGKDGSSLTRDVSLIMFNLFQRDTDRYPHVQRDTLDFSFLSIQTSPATTNVVVNKRSPRNCTSEKGILSHVTFICRWTVNLFLFNNGGKYPFRERERRKSKQPMT